jgi:hypothetical protein
MNRAEEFAVKLGKADPNEVRGRIDNSGGAGVTAGKAALPAARLAVS